MVMVLLVVAVVVVVRFSTQFYARHTLRLFGGLDVGHGTILAKAACNSRTMMSCCVPCAM